MTDLEIQGSGTPGGRGKVAILGDFEDFQVWDAHPGGPGVPRPQGALYGGVGVPIQKWPSRAAL